MTVVPDHSDFDIAISGAGPVGLAHALLLCRRGIDSKRIALFDARPADSAATDPRAIALSWGSRQLLEQIGAWPSTVTTIREIHVSRKGHFGRTLIDCREQDLPALGYVTRYGNLAASLQAAAERAGIVQIRPAKLIDAEESETDVRLQLEGRADLTCRIAVQAEGGLFADQAAAPRHHDYEQTAIVAHVKCSAPLAERAFERFTDEGPLALLPQDDGYALVWCSSPANAGRLLTLSDANFLSALQQAFGMRLGAFTAAGPRHAFPLGLNVRHAAGERTVAIGNAAQTLHPVAGQGLNLGLRDAAVLAGLLARDLSPAALTEFSSLRSSDRDLTIRLTDTMARVFAATPGGSPLQALLGLSLGVMDAVTPLKSWLAEQMMYGRR
jgi:2-octaprenyl-6-methoxyphenol hydroxylase